MNSNKNKNDVDLEDNYKNMYVSRISDKSHFDSSLATGKNCWQTTLKLVKKFNGIGLHSGNKVNLTIKPGEENSGIIFVRTDLDGDIEKRTIRANYKFVSDTSLCTTITNSFGIKVSTIEHIMAAFNGSGIDNALVEIDNSEVPIMDGSSLPFLKILEDAGIIQQTSKRRVIKILKVVEVSEGDKFCSFSPSNGSDFSAQIDFESLVIGKQEASLSIEGYGFKEFAANARTFGFMKDVEHMKSLGLGLGGSLDNCIIIDNNEVINPDGLRHKNEFSRHKLLDAVGDIYTAGFRIQGLYRGICAGHYMNNLLLKELFALASNYEIIDYPDLSLNQYELGKDSKMLVS